MRCDDRQPPDKRLPPLVNKVAGDADHVGQELGWGAGEGSGGKGTWER